MLEYYVTLDSIHQTLLDKNRDFQKLFFLFPLINAGLMKVEQQIENKIEDSSIPALYRLRVYNELYNFTPILELGLFYLSLFSCPAILSFDCIEFEGSWTPFLSLFILLYSSRRVAW